MFYENSNDNINIIYKIIMHNIKNPHLMIFQNDDEDKLITNFKSFSLDIFSSFIPIDMYFRYIRKISILENLEKKNLFIKKAMYEYIKKYKNTNILINHDEIYNDDLLLLSYLNNEILIIPFIYEISKKFKVNFTSLLYTYVNNIKGFLYLINKLTDNNLAKLERDVHKNILKLSIKRTEIALILIYFYYILKYFKSFAKSKEDYGYIKEILLKYLKTPLFPNLPQQFIRVDIKDYDKVYNDFKLIKNITKIGLKNILIQIIKKYDKNNVYISSLNNFNNFIYISLQLFNADELVINIYGLIDDNSFLTPSSIKRLVKIIDKMWF